MPQKLGLSVACLLTMLVTMGWGQVDPCPQASLSVYQGFIEGNACSMGPLNFYGFGFMQLPVNSSPAPVNGLLPGYLTASDILVRPSQFGIGLDFVGLNPQVFNRDILIPERYYITYTVDPPPIVAGDEMRLDPPIGPITVTRWTCADTGGFNNSVSVKNTLNNLNPLQYSATTFSCLDDSKPTPYFIQADGLDNTPPELEDSVTYARLAKHVVVRMVIDLRPGNIKGLDGIVALTNVVPEPGAFVPLAAGIVGLGLYARRRRAAHKAKMLNS